MQITFKQERGFTLIELLVSVLIFVMVLLGIYSLFDQGSWVYLHTNRRANIQQIARVAMEQMERDIRMAGFGIPTGNQFGDTTTWSPDIFLVTPGSIHFRADIDNAHSWVRQTVTGSSRTLSVEHPATICPSPGSTAITLVNDSRVWQPLTCMASDLVNGTIEVNEDPMTPCPKETCEIFTPEHIFYRLSGDADNDGICDNAGPNDEPFCTLQRAVAFGNDPVNDSIVPPDSQFENLASNIVRLNIQSTGLLEITLTVRDRSMMRAKQYQDLVLTTRILVRDNT